MCGSIALHPRPGLWWIVPIVDRTRLERDVDHVFDRHVLVATPSETKLSGTTFYSKEDNLPPRAYREAHSNAMKRGREEDVDGRGPSTSDGNRVLRHELGLVGGLMKSKWARWLHRLPVNGLVLTPGPGMQWAVLRPTRADSRCPLRDQVRASISGYRGDRASVETVSLGKRWRSGS